MLKNTLVSIVINNSNNEKQSVIDNNNKTYKKLLESTFRFECVVVDAFTSKKKSIKNMQVQEWHEKYVLIPYLNI